MALQARFLALATLVATSGVLGAGCYVEAGPPPAYVDGYDPMFYDGYVVYYDGVGRPYYYVRGGVVWISPAVPEYGRYVSHWHQYHPTYHTWYADHGYRYRDYRYHHR